MALAYGLICVAGMLAALFPAACSGIFGIRSSSYKDVASLDIRATRVLGVFILHGHHAPGPEERTHELRLDGKSFCATCYGLLTGAIISLTLVVVFTLSGSPLWLDWRVAYAFYGLGVLGVFLGLVQTLALHTSAWTRFALATVFVVGTGLMLVATDALTASLTADLFVVLLAVFWLLSRISLSHKG